MDQTAKSNITYDESLIRQFRSVVFSEIELTVLVASHDIFRWLVFGDGD